MTDLNIIQGVPKNMLISLLRIPVRITKLGLDVYILCLKITKNFFLLFFVLFLGVTVQHHRHVNLDIVDRNI